MAGRLTPENTGPPVTGRCRFRGCDRRGLEHNVILVTGLPQTPLLTRRITVVALETILMEVQARFARAWIETGADAVEIRRAVLRVADV